MKNKLVVIGGYGQVGQIICGTLGDLFPGKVYAAGRSYEKAVQFSSTTGNKVLPMQLDVSHSNASELLEEGTVVVMCLDQVHTHFVERCIEKNIDYIDISASHAFLSKVDSLKNHLKPIQSTAVLSVGLSPGITNMLVKHSAAAMDELQSAHIFLMLGLGERHGKAAIEWMVDNLNSEFAVMENGSYQSKRSFEDGKAAAFPGKLGLRTAYRFNFSDQHVLPTTLDLKSVSTRICFDSAFITRLVAFLKKLGVYRLVRIPSIRQLLIKLFQNYPGGSEIYAAKVVANGIRNKQAVQYECSIQGEKESFITGKVAVFVAKHLFLNKCQPGIFHMEQLFMPMELIEELSEWISFEERVIPLVQYRGNRH